MSTSIETRRIIEPVRLLGVSLSNFLSENKKNDGQMFFDF